MTEELEWIEIVSRQHMCQRALMTDKTIRLFFDMIRLVDEQLEKVVASREAFDGNGNLAGEAGDVEGTGRLLHL